MNIGLIILGAVLLIIIVIVVLIVLAKMKGKIIITLDKYEFALGETINGILTLKLKKPVHAKSLNVGLVGTKETTSYNRKENQRKDSSDTIFDFKKPLDGEKDYPPGEQTYKFQLTIPKDLPKQTTGNQIADTLIKSAQILSGSTSRTNWFVTANLDMSGFDIHKEVRINIV